MAQTEAPAWQYLEESCKSPVAAGRREGHCSCSVEDRQVYVFGGLRLDNDGNANEMNDLIRFDGKGGWNKVEATGNLPPARTAATLACVGRRLFLFGGLNQRDGWLNDLHAFDLDSSVWTCVHAQGPCPSPRDKAASASVGNQVYLFGGFGPQPTLSDDDDDEDEDDDGGDLEDCKQVQEAARFGWFNDLFVLDTDTLTWSQPIQMNLGSPTPRAAMALCSMGPTQLFIFGGRDAAGRCNDGYLFDTVTRKWTNLKQAHGVPPKPRSFHSATSFGACAVVFGGRGSANEHYNDLFVYDSVANQWHELIATGDPPVARGCHVAGRLGGALVIYGGSGKYSDEVQQCQELYGGTCHIDVSASTNSKKDVTGEIGLHKENGQL